MGWKCKVIIGTIVRKQPVGPRGAFYPRVCSKSYVHVITKSQFSAASGSGMSVQAEIKDFDQVLNYVGGWSYYQALMFLLSLPFAMMMAFATYTPVLFLYTPHHTCKSPGAPSDNLQCTVIDEGQVIHYLSWWSMAIQKHTNLI